jgi:hypothetical protein
MTHQNETNLTDIQETITQTNWMTHANCLGKTHLMFPKQHKDITYITQARNICKQCEVQTHCLNYALQYPPIDMHGVWAGHTSRQLAAEQKRRNIKPTKPSLAQMFPR